MGTKPLPPDTRVTVVLMSLSVSMTFACWSSSHSGSGSLLTPGPKDFPFFVLSSALYCYISSCVCHRKWGRVNTNLSSYYYWKCAESIYNAFPSRCVYDSFKINTIYSDRENRHDRQLETSSVSAKVIKFLTFLLMGT